MNIKEINAMTDEELCVKAAELSGWEDVAVRLVNNLIVEDAMFEAVCGKPDSGPEQECGGWLVGDGENMFDVVDDYPNCIASAWKLTNYIPGCRWSVYELDEGGWAAVVMGKIEPINGRTLWDVVAESGPDTAPRAITKAFIMAMEAE